MFNRCTFCKNKNLNWFIRCHANRHSFTIYWDRFPLSDPLSSIFSLAYLYGVQQCDLVLDAFGKSQWNDLNFQYYAINTSQPSKYSLNVYKYRIQREHCLVGTSEHIKMERSAIVFILASNNVAKSYAFTVYILQCMLCTHIDWHNANAPYTGGGLKVCSHRFFFTHTYARTLCNTTFTFSLLLSFAHSTSLSFECLGVAIQLLVKHPSRYNI